MGLNDDWLSTFNMSMVSTVSELGTRVPAVSELGTRVSTVSESRRAGTSGKG